MSFSERIGGTHRIGHRADVRERLPEEVSADIASSGGGGRRYGKALKILGLEAHDLNASSASARRLSSSRLSLSGSFAADTSERTDEPRDGLSGRGSAAAGDGRRVFSFSGHVDGPPAPVSATGGGGGYSKAFKLLGLGGGGAPAATAAATAAAGGSGNASAPPSGASPRAGGTGASRSQSLYEPSPGSPDWDASCAPASSSAGSVRRTRSSVKSFSSGGGGEQSRRSTNDGLGGEHAQSRRSMNDGAGSFNEGRSDRDAAAGVDSSANKHVPSSTPAAASPAAAPEPASSSANSRVPVDPSAVVVLQRLDLSDQRQLPVFRPLQPQQQQQANSATATVAGQGELQSSSSAQQHKAQHDGNGPSLFLEPGSTRLGIALLDVNLRDDAPPGGGGLSSGGLPLVGTGGSKYAVYLIRVTMGPSRSWLVQRRYREFAALHSALSLVVPQHRLPSLPGKSISGGLGGLKPFQGPALVRQRMRELAAYLRLVVRIPEAWACDALILFLDDAKRTLALQAQFARTMQLTQALAASSFATDAKNQRMQGELEGSQSQLAALKARLAKLSGLMSASGVDLSATEGTDDALARGAGTLPPGAVTAVGASPSSSSSSRADALVESLAATIPDLLALDHPPKANPSAPLRATAALPSGSPASTGGGGKRSRSSFTSARSSFTGGVSPAAASPIENSAPLARLRASGLLPTAPARGSSALASTSVGTTHLGAARLVQAAFGRDAAAPLHEVPMAVQGRLGRSASTVARFAGSAAVRQPGSLAASPATQLQQAQSQGRPGAAPLPPVGHHVSRHGSVLSRASSVASASSASFLWGTPSFSQTAIQAVSPTSPQTGSLPPAGSPGSFASAGSSFRFGSTSGFSAGGGFGSFTGGLGSFTDGDIDDVVSVILGALPPGAHGRGSATSAGGASLSASVLLGRASVASRLSIALGAAGQASFAASPWSVGRQPSPSQPSALSPPPQQREGDDSRGRSDSGSTWRSALSQSFYGAVRAQLQADTDVLPREPRTAPVAPTPTAKVSTRRRALSDSALPELRACVDALLAEAERDAKGGHAGSSAGGAASAATRVDGVAQAPELSAAAVIAARQHDSEVSRLQDPSTVAAETAALAPLLEPATHALQTSAAAVSHALDALSESLEPTSESNERRRDIVSFVTGVIRNTCSLEAFPVGSTAAHCYAPSSGIDLVVVLPPVMQSVPLPNLHRAQMQLNRQSQASSAGPGAANAEMEVDSFSADDAETVPPPPPARPHTSNRHHHHHPGNEPTAPPTPEQQQLALSVSASSWFVGVSEALCRVTAVTQQAAAEAAAAAAGAGAAHIAASEGSDSSSLTSPPSAESLASAEPSQAELLALMSALRTAAMTKRGRVDASSVSSSAFHLLRSLCGQDDVRAQEMVSQLMSASDRIAQAVRECKILAAAAAAGASANGGGRNRGASASSLLLTPVPSPPPLISTTPPAVDGESAPPSMLPASTAASASSTLPPSTSAPARRSPTELLAAIELDAGLIRRACAAAAVARGLLETAIPGGRDLEVVEDSAYVRLLRDLAAQAASANAVGVPALGSAQASFAAAQSGGGGGSPPAISLWHGGPPSWAVAADGHAMCLRDVSFDACDGWHAYAAYGPETPAVSAPGAASAVPPSMSERRPFLRCTIDNVPVTIAATFQRTLPVVHSLHVVAAAAAGTPWPAQVSETLTAVAALHPAQQPPSPPSPLLYLQPGPSSEVSYPLFLEDADDAVDRLAAADSGPIAAVSEAPASLLPSQRCYLTDAFRSPPAQQQQAAAAPISASISAAGASAGLPTPAPTPSSAPPFPPTPLATHPRRHLLKRSIALLTAWLRQESLSGCASPLAQLAGNSLLLSDSVLLPASASPPVPGSACAQQLPPRALHSMLLALFTEAAKPQQSDTSDSAAAAGGGAQWRAALPPPGTCLTVPSQVFTAFVGVYGALDFSAHVVSPLLGIVSVSDYARALTDAPLPPTQVSGATVPAAVNDTASARPLLALYRQAMESAGGDLWSVVALRAALPIASRVRSAGDGAGAAREGAADGDGDEVELEARHDGFHAPAPEDAATAEPGPSAHAPPAVIAVEHQREKLLRKLRGAGAESSPPKAGGGFSKPQAKPAGDAGDDGEGAGGGINPAVVDLLSSCGLPLPVLRVLADQALVHPSALSSQCPEGADGDAAAAPSADSPLGHLGRVVSEHVPQALRGAIALPLLPSIERLPSVRALGASRGGLFAARLTPGAAAKLSGPGNTSTSLVLPSADVVSHIADPLHPWINASAGLSAATVSRLQLACAAARSALASAATATGGDDGGTDGPAATEAAAETVALALFPGLCAALLSSSASEAHAASSGAAAYPRRLGSLLLSSDGSVHRAVLSQRPDMLRWPGQRAVSPRTLASYRLAAADVQAALAPRENMRESQWGPFTRGVLRLGLPMGPGDSATPAAAASDSPLSTHPLPATHARDYLGFVGHAHHGPRHSGAVLARMACARGGVMPVGHLGQAIKTHPGCAPLPSILRVCYGGLRAFLASCPPFFAVTEDYTACHNVAVAGREPLYPHMHHAMRALIAAGCAFTKAVHALEEGVCKTLAPKVYATVAKAIACGAPPELPHCLTAPALAALAAAEAQKRAKQAATAECRGAADDSADAHAPSESGDPMASPGVMSSPTAATQSLTSPLAASAPPAAAAPSLPLPALLSLLLFPPEGFLLPAPPFVPSPVGGSGGGARPNVSPPAAPAGRKQSAATDGSGEMSSASSSTAISAAIAGAGGGYGSGNSSGVTLIKGHTGPSSAGSRTAISTAFVVLTAPAGVEPAPLDDGSVLAYTPAASTGGPAPASSLVAAPQQRHRRGLVPLQIIVPAAFAAEAPVPLLFAFDPHSLLRAVQAAIATLRVVAPPGFPLPLPQQALPLPGATGASGLPTSSAAGASSPAKAQQQQQLGQSKGAKATGTGAPPAASFLGQKGAPSQQQQQQQLQHAKKSAAPAPAASTAAAAVAPQMRPAPERAVSAAGAAVAHGTSPAADVRPAVGKDDGAAAASVAGASAADTARTRGVSLHAGGSATDADSVTADAAASTAATTLGVQEEVPATMPAQAGAASAPSSGDFRREPIASSLPTPRPMGSAASPALGLGATPAGSLGGGAGGMRKGSGGGGATGNKYRFGTVLDPAHRAQILAQQQGVGLAPYGHDPHAAMLQQQHNFYQQHQQHAFPPHGYHHQPQPYHHQHYQQGQYGHPGFQHQHQYPHQYPGYDAGGYRPGQGFPPPGAYGYHAGYPPQQQQLLHGHPGLHGGVNGMPYPGAYPGGGYPVAPAEMMNMHPGAAEAMAAQEAAYRRAYGEQVAMYIQQQQHQALAAAAAGDPTALAQAQVQAHMQAAATARAYAEAQAHMVAMAQQQQQQAASPALAAAGAPSAATAASGSPPEMVLSGGSDGAPAVVDRSSSRKSSGAPEAAAAGGVTAQHLLGHLQYADGTLVPVALGSDGQAYAMVSHAQLGGGSAAGAVPSEVGTGGAGEATDAAASASASVEAASDGH